MNKIIQKKKFYKKLLMPLMAILGIALVSAIGYYAIFSATITVAPSITLSTDCSDSLNALDGEITNGKDCTLTNVAETKRNLVITNNADTIEGIDVSYIGTLELAQKDLETWDVEGATKTITYTIIGDELTADVPEGYTLIYYPNTEGDVFTTNVANVLVYDSDTFPNLPISLDVGDDYCNNGHNPDAKQCVGAKLWLIEGTESEALAKLSAWDATEFLFETELIQYNADGEITLSPGASLTITPVYTIAPGVLGSATITTEVA